IAEVTEDMLPKNVSQWVNDVAKRMWIYPTYPSVALISFVSAIIARRVAIHPKKYDVEWRVIPNIWGAIVGQPGVQKSPALTPMFEPIARFQKHLKDEYNEALKQHKKELQQWKLQPKTTRGEKPTEPALRVLSVNDATMEAIHLAHLTNPQGLLLYRDELSGLIAEMGKQGREGQRQFFLEGWNGNGQYSMMRLSRENVDVEGLCLTIFGGIQPNILAQYIANTSTGKADDGFIQRFQLLVNSVPKADYKLIDVAPDYDGKAMFDKTIDRLLYLPMHGDPVITAFSDDAQPRFNAWLENLERRIRANTMPSILTSHISKYRSLLPSLALVFETISNEEFNLENMRDGKLLPRVSLESLELGIRWCDFLETHARSMLLDSPCEASPSALLAEKLIQKYKSGKWKDGATERSIKRLSRAKMDNQYFDDALELLHEFGYIKIEQHQPKRGGTPSNIIIVNPAITNDHQKAVKPAETEVPMANPQPNPQPELREKLLGIWNDQSCQTLEQVLARLESIDEISEQAWDNISILLSDFKSESNPTTTLKYDRDIFLRQVAEYSGLPSRV
ncbi:MAG: YfjI family protein, partial [Pseudomonadota bacterium]